MTDTIYWLGTKLPQTVTYLATVSIMHDDALFYIEYKHRLPSKAALTKKVAEGMANEARIPFKKLGLRKVEATIKEMNASTYTFVVTDEGRMREFEVCLFRTDTMRAKASDFAT